MKLRKILALFTATVSIVSANAQNPKIVPTSPEASALSKMINYPVNLNTGVPDISLPLYSIETGGLTLPIAINYHAGGFRINERATSVGLGWSLSCDIQITRSVNGKDDFSPENGYLANTKMKAYVTEYNQCANCEYPLSTGMNTYSIAAGNFDGMPDKFNYRLLHKAGSFYFRKSSSGTSYTIVPVPYDNIKIKYDQGQFTIIDTDGTEYTFGTPGPPGEIPIEVLGVERSGSGYPDKDYISAWKCKKIENATKTETIKFNYKPKSQIKFINSSDYVEYYLNENKCTGLASPYSYNTANLNTYQTAQHLFTYHSLSELLSPRYIEAGANKPAILTIPYINVQDVMVTKTFNLADANVSISDHTSSGFVNGLAIESIQFRGGSLIFSGADELNSIKVQNSTNDEIKSFVFFQSYARATFEEYAKNYNGYNFNGTRYLDSVHVKNANNTYSRYSLLYNSKFCFGSHLTGQDAWGYVNASTREIYPYATSSAPLSVPSNQISEQIDRMGSGCNGLMNTFNIGGSPATETPDRFKMKEGILRRIIYPTGGFVNFDFEANMYNEYVFTNVEKQAVRMGGGLRINSINYFDGTSKKPASQKYYRYGELEDGIGILVNKPSRTFPGSNNYEAFKYTQDVVTYISTLADDQGYYCPGGCLKFMTKEKVTTYLPASSMDYSYPTGAPIYYTIVNEYQSDLGTYTGKTIHEFYPPEKFQPNFYIGQNTMLSGTNIPMIHADGLMGVQKAIKEYKNTNGRFSLVHSKEFEYLKYQQPEQVRAVVAFFKVIYKTKGAYYGTHESLYHERNSGTPQNRFQDYVSTQYGIPVAKLLLSAEKEKWVNGVDTLSKNTGYYYDNTLYMQPSRIVTNTSEGSQLTKAIKYAYDFNAINVYNKMVLKNMIGMPVEEVITNTSKAKELSRTKTNYEEINAGFGFIAPASVQKSSRGNALETEFTFDLYDHYANPIEISGKDKLKKIYLWGYNYQYPIAEITGSNYGNVANLINTTTLQNSYDEQVITNTLNSLRTNLPDAMMSSYTYKPFFGMTSVTDPNGKKKYYEYDQIGRLAVIKDQNGFVVSKYGYNETGPLSSLAFGVFTVNNPIMVSMFGKYCPPNEKHLPLNRIQVGGSHVFASDVENSNANVQDLVQGGYGSFIENSGDCSEVSESVLITLKAFIFNGLPTPYRVYFELLQDNSLLASREFPYGEDSKQFFVKQGKYRMSMRHISNQNNSNLTYSIQPSVGASFSALPGDVITFIPGINYQITISNAF